MTVYPVDIFTLTDTSDFRKAKNFTKNFSEYASLTLIVPYFS